LMKLRRQYPNTFMTNNVGSSLNGAFKSIQLTHTDLSLAVVGNFDVSTVNGNITLQNSGTWYNYLTGEPFTATGGSQNFMLAPGEYKLLVNKNVVNAVVTGVNDIPLDPNKLQLVVFPNPANASSLVVFSNPRTADVQLRLSDLQGRILSTQQLGRLMEGRHQVALTTLMPAPGKLSKGVYFLTLAAGKETKAIKIVF